MITADQPQDMTARLDNVDAQLEALGDEIDLIRTIQGSVRRETRSNNQTAARLERTVARLADIARDHQVALRIASQNAERDAPQERSSTIALCFKPKYSASGSIYDNKEATGTVQLTDKIAVNVRLGSNSEFARVPPVIACGATLNAHNKC